MPSESPFCLENAHLALLTDLYQLTMAHGYWKAGLQEVDAVFHLSYRHQPFGGGFAVASGLESVVDFIRSYKFYKDDLDYLRSVTAGDGSPLFDLKFFDFLERLKFTCDVDAIPEGTTVFPYEPLIRVKGPLIQCQLLETPLLNLINFPTLIATKAARICIAAEGDMVYEFGVRRAQGIDGALTASRSAYVGGCSGTSHVLAGKLFGIPVRGTHAHSWVQVFDDETEAFEKYAETSPNNCILLVDTFNTLEGIKKAIAAGKKLQARGGKFQGIRLDSGDLAYLSIIGRKLLDEAGFTETKIVASNELDERIISELKRQGARIDIWGVGTNLVTAKEQPALDGVYKLSAVRWPGEEWKYRLKLSEQMMKVSNPGILQVRRYYDNNENISDVIYDIHSDLSKGCVIIDPLDSTRKKSLSSKLYSKDLLVPVFRNGVCVYDLPSLMSIRDKTKQELNAFHSGIKRFLNPHQYIVGMEQSLYKLKIDLIHQIRHREFPTVN